MPNENKNPTSARAPLKLSDTQLVLLSAAAQRVDHCLEATPNLKGGAAQKVAARLIAAGLVREIKARTGTPIWHREEETAQSFALKLTAAGMKAIAVDDVALEEEDAEPVHPGSETRRQGAPYGDLAARGPNNTRLKGGQASRGGPRQPGEGGAPSAPRSGSKTAEIINRLQRAQGATIDDLIAATGWLPHTTRAALTGLRKRGYEIVRSRSDGITLYRIERADRALAGPKVSLDVGVGATLRNEQAA